MRFLSVLSILVFLTACSPFPHRKVEPWPQLEQEVITYPNIIQTACACAEYTGMICNPLVFPIACATIRLDLGKCFIRITEGYDPEGWLFKHEQAHCDGYDHFPFVVEPSDHYKWWLEEVHKKTENNQ